MSVEKVKNVLVDINNNIKITGVENKRILEGLYRKGAITKSYGNGKITLTDYGKQFLDFLIDKPI